MLRLLGIVVHHFLCQHPAISRCAALHQLVCPHPNVCGQRASLCKDVTSLWHVISAPFDVGQRVDCEGETLRVGWVPAIQLGHLDHVLCQQFQHPSGTSKPTARHKVFFHAGVFQSVQHVGVCAALLTGFFPDIHVGADVVSDFMDGKAGHHVCLKAVKHRIHGQGWHVDLALQMTVGDIPACASRLATLPCDAHLCRFEIRQGCNSRLDICIHRLLKV